MQPPSSLNFSTPIEIPRCDRWRIHRRLEELMISSSCPVDGSLQVEIQYVIDLVLVRSTVQQFMAPRQELVNWLERCWYSTVICQENH
jgi:hypothetical protein